ncbi:MAG: nucleoside-diphosphate sugar epimerase/dehydratase [Candidatus Humimicrobiaceae bacterium]|jgi:FlaA1/EpsC-like NDP-sugar epimerase|nr:nucleoside-diphosphate sugar epimerase/dehydratase [Actinomycetota bacterium]MDY0027516.1 nucleoside-diphosphate sugar epimerase/dehydratase [Candidatus Humimicrobiaceae bacterium]
MKKKSVLKIIGQVLFDVLIIFSSFVISFFLRGQIGFDGSADIFSRYARYMVWYVVIAIAVKIIILWIFGAYKRVWKYASIKDMVAILEAVTLGSVVIAVIFYILTAPISFFGININFHFPYFPRGILVIDYLLTLTLMIISKFSERFFNELKLGSGGKRKKRVLVVGAGDAGEMIVREMIRQKESEYLPVGFLDDDYTKIKNKIHGVSVLGPISKMEKIVQDYSVEEVIIAMPSASGSVRKEVAVRARELGVNCKTLPGLYEIIDGKVYLYQVRDIEIEDILGREVIDIKIPEVVSEIKDKVIMVTGAGGSIGSEICRQVIRLKPKKIILVDHSENNLFLILEELSNKFAFISTVPIVIDIRDKEALRDVFKKYKPDIVFHAAAYKHVPLMQLNPKAAFLNNYLGTKILAKLSIEFGVKRFVMLSTDKAVNPKNVMGISKLLAEKYLQTLSKVKDTRFIIVRFGNVLGSMGSVVPLFKEQIQSGGPVRVTHPDMKRYFMTIPEASQLVIQACIMGKGGEVYVLDMGEPINIVDLAKNMIRIYGMEPGKDIEIIYTGPRDGEKFDEELVSEDEELIVTDYKHIFEARSDGKVNGLSKDEMINILFNIEKEIQVDDYKNLFKDLKKIIPDFDENKMWPRLYE